jgi:hypothetical protein
MLVLWLLVWLFNSTPDIYEDGEWNNWAVGLVVCGVIDLLFYFRKAS